MKALELRESLIKTYHEYIRSFLHIRDRRIRAFAEEQLDSGVLWPEPLIQVSPCYEEGPSVDELIRDGQLHPLCAGPFGQIKLRKHQADALEAARAGEPYVLTTGTGSGKSLAYILPIFDHILRNMPEEGGVRAIIVYPMNALINSQEEALAEYALRLGGKQCPVRFRSYSGQLSREEKDQVLQNPPHIILTNYMMLELMLTRPEEAALVTGGGKLRFLVLDELHTYRGRQGADVAMLVRRFRQRCGNPNVLTVGTSATMISGADHGDRRQAVAEVASRIFGVPVRPERVIEETLVRSFPGQKAPTGEELRQSIRGHGSADDTLAGWAEATLGVREVSGTLERIHPIQLSSGAKLLADASGLPEEECLPALRDLFERGSSGAGASSKPLHFRLHQFISGGGSVYATLEPPEQRHLTLEPGYYYGDEKKLLYPLVFCRQCGQEYYQARRIEHPEAFVPVPALAHLVAEEDDSTLGYLVVDADPSFPIWREEDAGDLPEQWFNIRKNGSRGAVKKDYGAHLPESVEVGPHGKPMQGGAGCWWLQRPMVTCLRCGEIYNLREGSEFRKLARLTNEGRSTSTTLQSIAIISHLRSSTDIEESAKKLMSFTDNRQDASLQAGHFNDFVQVALFRTGICAALKQYAQLDYQVVAASTVECLAIREIDFARQQGLYGDAAQRNREAFEALVEYRIYQDLRRGWRIIQPNLEQCGLLRIDYRNLDVIAADPAAWVSSSVLAAAAPEERNRAIRALLDHMRRELAIDAPLLRPERQGAFRKQVDDALRAPFSFSETEKLRQAASYITTAIPPRRPDLRSLSPASAPGRFLRSTTTWPGLRQKLTEEEYRELLATLLDVLRGAAILTETGGQFQLRNSSLLWLPGDGNPPPPDPIRTRRMNPRHRIEPPPANRFFAGFYGGAAANLSGIRAGEHTAQLSSELRREREQKFGSAELACLYCSPTMELGIDIKGLNVVHMRNVPPTPANYAQRSGRAGRSGHPALISTYCAYANGHDQYFFERQSEMVAGSVAPPRIDLANEDLLRSHVHAVWLFTTGRSLGAHIDEILCVDTPGFPIRQDLKPHFQLSERAMENCLSACRTVLHSCVPALKEEEWYSDDWLTQTLRGAAQAFDRAFDRWRSLYEAALAQRERGRRIEDQAGRSSAGRATIEEAQTLMNEANQQIKLLCCVDIRSDESDFYPYRYLAGEGFLPGYNFPRLPVRAFLPTGGGRRGQYVSRARFLALEEFGPQNIIYHVGAKYQVDRCVLAAGSPEERFISSKSCRECGFIRTHDLEDANLCENCGSLLGESGDYMTRLLEMPGAASSRRDQITCDEEERRREGYEVTTHFRFAESQHGPRRRQAGAESVAGAPLLHLTYAPAASLWRISHGWRRSPDGFRLSMEDGKWLPMADSPNDPPRGEVASGVRLFVRDTRNILLINSRAGLNLGDEELTSLQYALQRGIEHVFQIEERELQSERIGAGERRAILLWEATEGSAGVLRRLVVEPDALARVAIRALLLCHFAVDGEDEPQPARDCEVACYRCLLSYGNQREHPVLDRTRIEAALRDLALSTVRLSTEGRTYEEQYAHLQAQIDQRSPVEKRLLDHLFQTGRRLPDRAQTHLEDFYCSPDFYYEDERAVVFCDGSVHDGTSQARLDGKLRDELKKAGYTVVVIRYDRDIEEQVAAHARPFQAPTR